MLAPRARPRGPASAAVRARVLATACLIAALVAATGASAEEFGNHLYDRYQFGASGSQLWLGSNVRIDSETRSAGTDLDVAEDLGFSTNRFQPRLSFRWRPGHRHELEAGYQFARRSAEKTLGRTISVGDTSFAAGLQVHSVFNTDNAALTYRYAIMARERTQLGAALGLGAFFFKVGVDGLVSASSEGQGASADYRASESFVGPTLSLGLYGRFRSGTAGTLHPTCATCSSRSIATRPGFSKAASPPSTTSPRRWPSRPDTAFGVSGSTSVAKPKGSIIDMGFKGSVKYTENLLRLGLVLPL